MRGGFSCRGGEGLVGLTLRGLWGAGAFFCGNAEAQSEGLILSHARKRA